MIKKTVQKIERPLLEAAPMAGISDWIFRLLAFEQGCDLAYTEMISALGYLCAPENNRGNNEILTINKQEGPVILQLFGKEPADMALAAKKLEEKSQYTEININMGCPARKISGKGEGAALMREPGLAFRIVEEVKKAVKLPVSVKMRLGIDDEQKNPLQFAKGIVQAGAERIIIHGRTKEQGYSGRADWEAIGLIKQNVTIPVTANGDITSGEVALKALLTTGCDGLMIGRGALGNPWIFSEVAAALLGKPYQKPTANQKIQTALRHTQLMVHWKGEKFGIVEMRKHIGWYLGGLHGAAAVRANVNNAKTFCEVEDILLQYLNTLKNIVDLKK